MSEVLVLGAGGALGRALAAELARRGLSAQLCDRRACDLADPAAVERACREASPRWVFNAAAYTAVDRAEAEPAQAHAVNAAAPGQLARWCARHGATLIHYSTDFVFDGRSDQPYLESDAPAPLGVYGRTKREGELAALDASPGALVLRTAWLYGAGGRNFPSTLRSRLLAGEPLRCECDRFGSPTWTGELARASLALALAGQSGLVHAACAGATTWVAFARRMAERLGCHGAAIEPVAGRELLRPAARPAWSVLASARAPALLASWEEAQDGYLAAESL